ncbi:DNA methyltransferase [Azospirillum sp. TSA2s]|uniref:DNA methyltransferase n=1 Tax=Azospirillum sp. TSA2s TaxID=709810 RepID=UPI00145BB6B9|nr:DNA methyltransferase [Azospirillum sp. TSA2s]
MIEPVIIGGGRIVAYNADCRDVLRLMKERGERVHAMHSDPPYHLTSIVKRFGKEGAAPAVHGTDGAFARASRGFMGKEWDGGDIAFDPETWRLHLDALLPGGYLTAFASSRGFGRMSVAIEDAGFVTHPMLGWIFGSGMPKATRLKAPETDHLRYGGQSLKPALEPIFMGQKPMEGTGTANWLQHGVGPLDIDAARVATDEQWHASGAQSGGDSIACYGDGLNNSGRSAGHVSGRWPANVVQDGSPEVLEAFEAFGTLTSGTGAVKRASSADRNGNRGAAYGVESRPNGTPMICHGDTGSASRFFYEAKAAEDDRWFWCPVCETAGPARAMGAHQHGRADTSHLVSHPTVKPLALARWLVRLTCPQRGQTVFDGFAGTGTTGVACLAEGRRAILCERDPDYFRILVARCQHYAGEGAFALPGKVAKGKEIEPLPLFGSAAE